MDPLADIFAGLGVALSCIALWRTWRESQQRSVWERQQERRQIAFDQPDLVPAGASFQGLRGKPYQLSTDGEHEVQIHNEGNSTPSDVQVVLFPSILYIVPGSQPPMHVYGLGGKYWEGRVDVSPPADGRCSVSLLSKSSPLQGKMEVIRGQTLFAPQQPSTGAGTVQAPYFFARLTLTYRDRTGRLLASAFDMDADTMTWHKVAGPVEVEHDLRNLANNTGSAVGLLTEAQDHK